MPTYQYACTQCGHAFDQVQSFSDDSLTDCPQCQGALRKVYSAVGVVFKGSGFYRTDSRGKATGGSESSGEASGSSEKSGDAGSGKDSSKAAGDASPTASPKSDAPAAASTPAAPQATPAATASSSS